MLCRYSLSAVPPPHCTDLFRHQECGVGLLPHWGQCEPLYHPRPIPSALTPTSPPQNTLWLCSLMNALIREESLDDFLILIFPHADGYTVITVCGAYSCPVGLEELADVINMENIINSPTVMYTLRGLLLRWNLRSRH